MPDTTILGFDTSAAHCAAALLRGGTIRAQRHEVLARGQAERLMPLLEEVLAADGLGWRDLDAIAVGIGPGNFTGTRISVAAARGLALSLGVPALGVSTFEVLHAPAPPWHGPDLVALEGPRGTAYVQPFRDGAATDRPQQIDPDAPPPGLARPDLRVVGHRAADLARHLGATALETALADIGARIVALAARRLAAGTVHERPAPVYVRPPDAAPPRDAAPAILG